jgi:hypothetical protein
MTLSVLIPISDVYLKGDYTAPVHIGSQQQSAKLIFNNGSVKFAERRFAFHRLDKSILAKLNRLKGLFLQQFRCEEQ